MSGNERGAEIARNAHLIELQKGSIELGAKHASCQKITWAEEVAGTVGGAPGKIGKRTGEQSSGTHQPVVAYYIYTAIPGAAKPVLCVAHYPTSHPELEKDVVTAFTGLSSRSEAPTSFADGSALTTAETSLRSSRSAGTKGAEGAKPTRPARRACRGTGGRMSTRRLGLRCPGEPARWFARLHTP